MIKTDVSTLKIHKLTQAQYEREREAGRLDENALYLTPDESTDLSLYVTTDKLNDSITDALALAKASGEFDGKDYVLTDGDKAEIVAMVLADMPTYTGEVEVV